jgi:hypothetical protein
VSGGSSPESDDAAVEDHRYTATTSCISFVDGRPCAGVLNHLILSSSTPSVLRL